MQTVKFSAMDFFEYKDGLIWTVNSLWINMPDWL